MMGLELLIIGLILLGIAIIVIAFKVGGPVIGLTVAAGVVLVGWFAYENRASYIDRIGGAPQTYKGG